VQAGIQADLFIALEAHAGRFAGETAIPARLHPGPTGENPC
jgi:hypothetical protein